MISYLFLPTPTLKLKLTAFIISNKFITFIIVILKSCELFRLMKKDGWFEVRQKGSHIIMKHPTKSNVIFMPLHASKEMKKGTLQFILKLPEIKTSKR